ncbi:MAG: hypothetical protein WBD93_21600 [Acidobacteriaceae bacterium]
MDPILVPAPPRSAYNPNRRVSDLILGQLKHFQHVEQKHGRLDIDPAIARDIHTEAGAARYITAVTRTLRNSGAAKISEPAKALSAALVAPPAPATNLSVVPTPKAANPVMGSGLAIAASASQSPAEKAVVKKTAVKKKVAEKTDQGAAKRKK